MSVTKKHGSRDPSSKLSRKSKHHQLVTMLPARVEKGGYHIEFVVCKQNLFCYQMLQTTQQRQTLEAAYYQTRVRTHSDAVAVRLVRHVVPMALCRDLRPDPSLARFVPVHARRCAASL